MMRLAPTPVVRPLARHAVLPSSLAPRVSGELWAGVAGLRSDSRRSHDRIAG